MDPCTQAAAPRLPTQEAPENRSERLLPPAEDAAGTARDFVRTTLLRWGLSEHVDDATLIAAELFNNAVRHAPSKDRGYVLALDRSGGMPRIEMWDHSDKRPVKVNPDNGSENGRGLQIIDALATEWGSRLAASGKCVWVAL